MNLTLTPSFVLTTEHSKSRYGIPVLVNLTDGAVYGPADMLQPYRSHALAPAAHFVFDALGSLELSAAERSGAAEYLRQWPDGPQLPPNPNSPTLDLSPDELAMIDEVMDEMHQDEHGVPRPRKLAEGMEAMQERVRLLTSQLVRATDTLARFSERDEAWHERMYRNIDILKRDLRIAEQRLAAYTDEHQTGHTRAN